MLNVSPVIERQQAPRIAPTLGSLARQFLREAKNDAESAGKALMERLLKNDGLLDLVIEAAITEAVYSSVGAAIRHDRRAVIGDVERPASTPALDGSATLGVLRRNLLEFPLAGGLRLRDANRAQVLAQVDRYSTQAEDMAHKARWLKRVAEATPAKKRVGQVLSADDLAKLFDEARS